MPGPTFESDMFDSAPSPEVEKAIQQGKQLYAQLKWYIIKSGKTGDAFNALIFDILQQLEAYTASHDGSSFVTTCSTARSEFGELQEYHALYCRYVLTEEKQRRFLTPEECDLINPILEQLGLITPAPKAPTFAHP
ncbi:MAG: hypothetical protein A3C55_06695 [Gammaproteobacteria bacterium RIFCSPHIGHO2_02_FULL_42_13]|nr:MAG: hypothetical protein A3C55_06695 [Gammaproteobacteria bacterium RIFCSPHIGHO2_02_FULL_42_13]OGT67977.1 MAG: hypothetical protein A3H43_03465 [Gammaproteobacteria bacterium RIFCSPLOWO2_02_FULL_42_9]